MDSLVPLALDRQDPSIAQSASVAVLASKNIRTFDSCLFNVALFINLSSAFWKEDSVLARHEVHVDRDLLAVPFDWKLRWLGRHHFGDELKQHN